MSRVKVPNTPVVIAVSNVSKFFKLPHEQAGSVKQMFTGLLRGRTPHAEKQRALQRIDFSIHQGEFLGIVGRNGSGKSTLLKLLAGIYQPSEGSVRVDGKLVPFIELGVGFNPELTGRENVFLNGALLGFSKKEVAAMYDDIVDFAEIERFMDQKLKNYSSGMQVRLAFSLAIRANADILLIDEVLAVGDADFQRKCFSYFKLLKKQKKTVVFVTHDMGAVREYCDRAILIDRSHLVAEGNAEDIAEQYTRLFNESIDDERQHDKNSGERWGDTAAVVESVVLDKKMYEEKDHTMKLTVNIVANQEVEHPIIGFSIKDAADNTLFGTNTKIKKLKLDTMQAGERHQVIWTFPNILADGRHYVTATIEHEDGVTVCDWWTEALAFTVRKHERTAYAITPPIDVTLVK